MRELGRERPRAARDRAGERLRRAYLASRAGISRRIADALADEGYRFGALVINAVPLRPAVAPARVLRRRRGGEEMDVALSSPMARATSGVRQRLRRAYSGLREETKRRWIWWSPPAPPGRITGFARRDRRPADGRRMALGAGDGIPSKPYVGRQSQQGQGGQKAGRRIVGTAYRRTRPDESGQKRQRAEARFDEVFGCLRTPAGGSSQTDRPGGRGKEGALAPAVASRGGAADGAVRRLQACLPAITTPTTSAATGFARLWFVSSPKISWSQFFLRQGQQERSRRSSEWP